MLAEFQIIGRVGRITSIKKEGKNKQVYMSVVTSRNYQSRFVSTWHNNIIAFGEMASYIEDKLQKGNVVRVYGTISVQQSKSKNQSDRVFFVIRGFQNISKSEAQKEEEIRKREENAAESDVYNSFEGDTPKSEEDKPY